jgi:hypothetical protein
VFAATGLPADDEFIRAEVDELCGEPGTAIVLVATFCQAQADCLRAVLPKGGVAGDLESVVTAMRTLDNALAALAGRIDASEDGGRSVAMEAIASFKRTHASTEAVRHGRAAL